LLTSRCCERFASASRKPSSRLRLRHFLHSRNRPERKTISLWLRYPIETPRLGENPHQLRVEALNMCGEKGASKSATELFCLGFSGNGRMATPTQPFSIVGDGRQKALPQRRPIQNGRGQL
jgi:hypothetical protein